MKTKIILCGIFCLCFTMHAYSQQDFKFHYDFKPILSNGNAKLYRVDNDKKLHEMHVNRNRLVGIIKSLTDITGDNNKSDTIKIRIWPIVDSTDLNSVTEVNRINNYDDFNIVIGKWPLKKTMFLTPSFSAIDIPFRSWQLFAVTIPFRINLKDGTVASDFINANLSVSHIWGKQRIYKSEFIKPRLRYFGVGGYFGVGTIKKDDTEHFGLNYGANFIQSVFNLKLIGTLGFETGLSKDGSTSPYLGVGLAFDLFSIAGGYTKD